MVGLQCNTGEAHGVTTVPAAGIVEGDPEHGIAQIPDLLCRVADHAFPIVGLMHPVEAGKFQMLITCGMETGENLLQIPVDGSLSIGVHAHIHRMTVNRAEIGAYGVGEGNHDGHLHLQIPNTQLLGNLCGGLIQTVHIAATVDGLFQIPVPVSLVAGNGAVIRAFDKQIVGNFRGLSQEQCSVEHGVQSLALLIHIGHIGLAVGCAPVTVARVALIILVRAVVHQHQIPDTAGFGADTLIISGEIVILLRLFRAGEVCRTVGFNFVEEQPAVQLGIHTQEPSLNRGRVSLPAQSVNAVLGDLGMGLIHQCPGFAVIRHKDLQTGGCLNTGTGAVEEAHANLVQRIGIFQIHNHGTDGPGSLMALPCAVIQVFAAVGAVGQLLAVGVRVGGVGLMGNLIELTQR